MGLDIYVGSYTRYYTGDWQTIIQQMGGVMIRPQTEQSEDAVTNPDQVRAAVVAWRDSMSAGLGTNLDKPFDWDESAAAPYFTDKPDWIGYGSLLVWAAYSEHPDLRPPTAPTDDWSSDPAFQKSVASDFKTCYPTLFKNVEVWLPSEFMFNFTGFDLAERETTFGSAYSLRDELHHLNTTSWKADERTVAVWRRCEEEPTSLEAMAKCAFAIFWDLTNAAIEHGLVMKLDY